MKMPIHKIIKEMVMKEKYMKGMKKLKKMFPRMERTGTVMKMTEVVKKLERKMAKRKKFQDLLLSI
jgi:hypothetical protein